MQRDVATGIFRESAVLLVRNPILLVPGLAFGIVAGVIDALIVPSDPLASNFWSRVFASIVSVFATALALAFSTGMADAIWRSGSCALSDGVRAFRRHGGALCMTTLALFFAGALAAVLAPLSAGLSFFLFLLLFLYAMPAAVVGERPGLRAVTDSMAIFVARPGPTLLVAAAVTIVVLVVSVVAASLRAAPFVGPFLETLALEAVLAYVALAIVGEYRALAKAPEPIL